jgi:glycosyltransferase involved in cell wall biosynthesis
MQARPMIVYVFRKRCPTVFSIEKLFDALFAQFEKTGASVGRIELPHISTGIVSVLRNIWFVARRSRAGLLHITGDVHYAALLRPFSKTVITIHDCVVLQRRTGFKGFVMRMLWFQLPLRLASAITVISEQTKSEVLQAVSVPERKITVIPNFVDPQLVLSERPFAAEEPRVLHVGTTDNKNLPKVIAALRGIPCVLVIVGALAPAMFEALRQSGVRYENHVGIDHAELARLYRNSDLISFPSTYEGFGMPILEGQAVGRPVLTSDLEPMRSVAGEGGALLVDPGSVDAIRAGFLALMHDAALRYRLVTAGKANCSRFTLESVAASYLALYREL